MTAEIRIGEWVFLPGEACLVRGGERRRLEHRAAEVLTLLATRRGLFVTSAELMTEVWGGRAVSANSVAVVISDLRRALDDDARVPRHIETVSKRGYRLIECSGAAAQLGEPEPSPEANGSRRWFFLALACFLFVAVSTVLVLRSQDERRPVAIGAFVNQTGNARYDALAASVRALVQTELGGLDTIRLEQNTNSETLVVSGRLVLWEGEPALALAAEDSSNSRIVWTGMATGPEPAFPRQVSEQIDLFGQSLAP